MNRLKSSDILTSEPIAPDWLVPGLLTRGAMIVLAGDAGVGKSMLCYSLAIALATGSIFLGRKLTPDRVLYFDEENSRPDSDAYHRRVWLGMGSPPIALLDQNLYLCHFGLTHAYASEMLAASREIKPSLIIIDTANAACRIDDENDNAKASAAIKTLRAARIASRPDCSVLILKHAKLTHDKHGKLLFRDIRGAKTWKSELDGMIIHTAEAGRPAHGAYRQTILWPAKTRAFGLTEPINIQPITIGEGVRFDSAP